MRFSTFCVLFSIRFEFTAINCPRSLQILHYQRMLSCTLQRIYSSVAIPSSSSIKKSLQFWRGLSCSMQTSNFRLCKRICSGCKTPIAQFKKNQKTAAILGSDNYSATTTKFTMNFNCTGSHCVEIRDSIEQFTYIFLF